MKRLLILIIFTIFLLLGIYLLVFFNSSRNFQKFRARFHGLRHGQDLGEIRHIFPSLQEISINSALEGLWWNGQAVQMPNGKLTVLHSHYDGPVYDSDFYLVFQDGHLIGRREAP